MPFRTIDCKINNPVEESLIVCAGTVTCTNVAGMGAGFNVFKTIFNNNIQADGSQDWQQVLNNHLDDYHSKMEAMPAYIRLAKQNTYIGGVATVPVKNGKGLTFDKFSDNQEKEKAYKKQYQDAVEQAIKDAQELNRPLYIQPLGIGVYGWSPQVAAELFADAIVKVDPDDKLDITIPIFDTSPSSNDKQFEQTLIKALASHGRNPVETTKEAITQKQSGPGFAQQSSVPSPLFQEKNKSNTITQEPTANQVKLANIVKTLIDNINDKKGTRWTSGLGSQKVIKLEEIRETILRTKPEQWSAQENELLVEIKEICAQKRNFFHFWATPESVTEFTKLLQEENLPLPNENSSLLKAE